MGSSTEIIVKRPLGGDAKQIMSLMRKSQNGDSKALRELVERYDDQAEFWQQVGDYAGLVEKRILDSQAGENLLFREGVQRQLAEMRAELAGPSPSPLERMLVDRVVASWLQVQVAEMLYNRRGISFEQATHEQKTLDRAHKRHLSAIKTLATVRRLQVPAMQVNIAEKQVNVAT